METILPILGAIVLIWLLSRTNHEDNGQKENIMDERASSEPNESDQAAVMLDEIDCERTGINSANGTKPCVAVYSIDKKENKMIDYSKAVILITASFPAPDECLAGFFRLKQAVVLDFEKEKQIIGEKE